MDDWIPGPLPGPPPYRRLPQPPSSRGGNSPWKPLEIPPDLSRSGLLVGTSGFHYEDWVGVFYPPRGVREEAGAGRERFPFYQMYFSFLEINHTFQREPDIAHFLELERRSRASMRFSVMAHRDVSYKGTWDPEEGKSMMRRHAAAVAPLADSGRFHSFLIQLDHRLERSRRVLDYLLWTASASLGEGLDVHIEFRNRTWHQASVLQALKDAGIGVCNADLPSLLPEAYPLRAYATTGKGYIRYSGQNAAAWDAEAARGSGASPSPRRAGAWSGHHSRYDYLYSLEELEERIPGQMLLLRKAGGVAAVFKNHVRGQAALNAAQNLFLAEGKLEA